MQLTEQKEKLIMGKGRAPCCDKSKVKRGPWSPQEDLKLIAFIQKYGHENWRALPKQAGLMRCGKSCRLRWINYLRPDVKRGNFTPEEEETIIRLHKSLGNKWSKIASGLPGRTDNEIKNVWNTHLKKKMAARNSESSGDESKPESSITSTSSSSSESFFSNESQNKSITTQGNEFNNQPSQVTTMKEKIEQVSNEVIGIIEDPKGTSPSLSSIESNIFNSSQIVDPKPEPQQLASPFLTYLGPYDVDKTLQEVDKPNHHLLEMQWETDYEFWKFLDNIGPFQPNDDQVQLGDFPTCHQNLNFGQEGVNQDAEIKKWSNELEKELGVGEVMKESNKDQLFQPRNDAIDSEMDPDTFHLDDMTRPESSELDLGYVQLWPSWPQNNASL